MVQLFTCFATSNKWGNRDGQLHEGVFPLRDREQFLFLEEKLFLIGKQSYLIQLLLALSILLLDISTLEIEFQLVQDDSPVELWDQSSGLYKHAQLSLMGELTMVFVVTFLSQLAFVGLAASFILYALSYGCFPKH